jgi:hypothetical protein
MKLTHCLASASLMLFCGSALGAPAKLSPADEAAAFKAAGFKLKGKQWRACDDPSPSYTPGAVEEVRDVNGDGRPEVVLTEGSTSCYGNTGAGYSLLSKQPDGSWKPFPKGRGFSLSSLPRESAAGRTLKSADRVLFSVERWNGQKYVLQRHQYEGKPCRSK